MFDEIKQNPCTPSAPEEDVDEEIKIEQVKELKSLFVWKDRFKTLTSGYKFDKAIFNGAMLFIFGFLFFIGHSYNWDMNYFKCGGQMQPSMFQGYSPDDYCENPFYKPATWQNEKMLPPGEYGWKPTPLFNSSWWVTIGLMIIAFLSNHLWYNKGRKPW